MESPEPEYEDRVTLKRGFTDVGLLSTYLPEWKDHHAFREFIQNKQAFPCFIVGQLEVLSSY
jgi:hypothetical protein